MSLTPQSRKLLIGVAERAIAAGSDDAVSFAAPGSDYPAEVFAERACFVTLSTASDGLRGCRGALRPRRPLVTDVWHNARASAFADPRFPPVQPAELTALRIEISVLGPLEPLMAGSQAELRGLLVPGRDGLLLASGERQATFLPKVWQMLPDPQDFLGHLMVKAGWPRDFWSPSLRIWRYQTETFGTAC
jgi:hypothetical protein